MVMLWVALLGCSDLVTTALDIEQGSGVPAERAVDVATAPEGIDVSDAMRVVLHPGAAETRAVVHADDNLIDGVEVVLDGKILRIGTEGNTAPEAPTFVEVWSTSAPRQITASGASRVESPALTNPELLLDASGSAKISVASTDAPLVMVKGSGAAEVRFGGVRAETLSATLSGSSGLVVEDGRVALLSAAMDGAAVLSAEPLDGDRATVAVSGAARVELGTFRELSAAASGAAKVHYDGDPDLESEATGAAKISRR